MQFGMGRKLRLELLTTAAVCLSAVSGVAFAQDAVTTTPAAKASDDAVIVTGTRIRRPNSKSAAPITTIDKQELQFQGVLNLEEAINRLPSRVAEATRLNPEAQMKPVFIPSAPG